jgi:Uma2 family endonuclease
MPSVTKSLSVDEFLALPDDGMQHELVRGELRTMPPSKGRHGVYQAVLVAALDRYLSARAARERWTEEDGPDARDALVGVAAVGEVGLQFAVPDDPRMIRGADAVYIPPEQLARVGWAEDDYFHGVPALVVEVVSASDRPDDVAEKIQDYLAGGARRVWCLYPRRRVVHIHDANAPTQVVRAGEVLRDEELLPGFALPVEALFPAPRGNAP